MKGTRPVPASEPADPAELRRFLMPPLSAFRGTAAKRLHEA
jgi:hypothetical protein